MSNCINRECGKSLEDGIKFCPYCRTQQVPPSPPPSNRPVKSAEIVILRPSDQVWEYTEPEARIAPGQPRPLLILDEQTVHLSHTDQQLDHTTLLDRIQAIIDASKVPVEVRCEPTCWQSDPKETRQRIIASLRGHVFSDYKMVFGVDYMGKWASINMCLAVQPPAIPIPVKPLIKPEKFLAATYICFTLMCFCMLIALVTMNPAMLIIIILFGIAAFYAMKQEKEIFNKKMDVWMQRNEEIKNKNEIRDDLFVAKLIRSYKVDDMRLFSSAMSSVFRDVVDNIVKKDGAQVERVDGGRGGFLNEGGMTQFVAPRRGADAAEVGL
jgi:hypothetical protein